MLHILHTYVLQLSWLKKQLHAVEILYLHTFKLLGYTYNIQTQHTVTELFVYRVKVNINAAFLIEILF